MKAPYVLSMCFEDCDGEIDSYNREYYTFAQAQAAMEVDFYKQQKELDIDPDELGDCFCEIGYAWLTWVEHSVKWYVQKRETWAERLQMGSW